MAEVRHLSLSYTAPYAAVPRARILLLAHQYPNWATAQSARTIGCARDTVKAWRRRGQRQGTLQASTRAGAPRHFPALVRAELVAVAWSKPSAHGQVWQRWAGEKRAQVAVAQGLVSTIAPGTLRRGRRQDKIKPWRSHSWPHSTDPHVVEKAGPVRELYARAQERATAQQGVGGVDEKTSIQARQRLPETTAAVPDHPVPVAARYRRMGAGQLFGGRLVATGLTFPHSYAHRRFADFKAFLGALFASALCPGLTVLHLLLDTGPTPAPTQLATGIASWALAFAVRLYWLPTSASGLDQGEIICSKVQRAVLTPNDFSSTAALECDLEAYFAELNTHSQPIKWT